MTLLVQGDDAKQLRHVVHAKDRVRMLHPTEVQVGIRPEQGQRLAQRFVQLPPQ